MNTVRQQSGTLYFLEEFEVIRLVIGGERKKEKMARVQCQCRHVFVMTLTRWKNKPPTMCRYCAVRQAKRRGFHGFRPRAKRVGNDQGLTS